jgi:hypothetical protein
MHRPRRIQYIRLGEVWLPTAGRIMPQVEWVSSIKILMRGGRADAD